MVKKCSWESAQKKKCRYVLDDDLRRYLVFSVIGTLLIAFGTFLISFDVAGGIINSLNEVAPFSFLIVAAVMIIIGAYLGYLARRS